jgi:Flp pilus assembly protein TadD
MANRLRLVPTMILVLASAHCASAPLQRTHCGWLRSPFDPLRSARRALVPASEPPLQTFAELAREVAEHDRANTGRGDWGAAACATLADRLEYVGRQGPRATAADALVAAAVVHERCNRPRDIPRVLELADRLQPPSCSVRVAIGHMYERAGHPELAHRVYATGACADAMLQYGRLSRSLATRLQPVHAAQMRGRALGAYRMVLRERVTDPRALAGLAQVYLDEARATSSQLALTSAESASANAVIYAAALPVDSPAAREEHAHIAHARAEVLVALGRIAPAIDHYRRAVEFAPDADEPRMNLASLLISTRDFAGAAAQLAIVVERHPTYDALLAQGVALARLGRSDDAQRAYERARDLEPSRPDAFFNLGCLYWSWGAGWSDRPRAIQYLEQFVQLANASGNPARYSPELQLATRRVSTIERRSAVEAAAAMNAANTP